MLRYLYIHSLQQYYKYMKKSLGFTLLELIVVIVAIVILVSMLIILSRYEA